MKPKEQKKAIEDKSNNQPEVAVIFDDLIKRKTKIMSELQDSVDYKI